MKNVLIVVLFLISQVSFSQKQLEDINIQTLNDIEIPLLSILKQEKDKPLVLFTWSKKWCGACVQVLNRFSDYFYDDLRNDYNLKFVALNLDQKAEDVEIKKFAIDQEWYFDIYKDPLGNYMEKLNISGAPQTYLIINNKIISYKSGFVDGISNAKTTADYIDNMVKSIGNKKIYFDENWSFSNADEASFVRYTDFIEGQYEVQDRWITGEIQMRGVYNDKWLSERLGKFKWYHKNGNKSSERVYSSNLLEGESMQWYENGQLWVKEEYNQGKLMNILELYSINGNKLNKGNLIDGNGFVYRYNLDGEKTSRQEYQDGQLHGKYIVYGDKEKIKSKHLYNEGNYIEELK